MRDATVAELRPNSLEHIQRMMRVKYALRFIPDVPYLKLYYRRNFGRWPDLKHPKTYNEKIQWLKLHDRNPRYTRMVDKLEAKKIAVEMFGAEHMIPVLGIWDRFDDIDFDALPDSFVLKVTHDSLSFCIVEDKAKLDLAATKAKMEATLRRNYYYIAREWAYKDVKPRIFAEKLVDDGHEGALWDYKFWCFGGEPKFYGIVSDKIGDGFCGTFFDMDQNPMPCCSVAPGRKDVPQPPHFSEMVEAARIASAGLAHLRVDFYDTPDQWYFGEYTFYHTAGFIPWDPPEYDRTFGDLIDLSLVSG